MEYERIEEPEDSPTRHVRERLAQVLGPVSKTSCGCEWKRLPRGGIIIFGARITGDVLIRKCHYHEWYASLPVEQQAAVSRAARASGKRS